MFASLSGGLSLSVLGIYSGCSEATVTEIGSLGPHRRSEKSSASSCAPTRFSGDFSRGQQGHFMESGRRLSVQDSHENRKINGRLSSVSETHTYNHGSSGSSFAEPLKSSSESPTDNIASLRSTTGTVEPLRSSARQTGSLVSSAGKNGSSRTYVSNYEPRRSSTDDIRPFVCMSSDNKGSLLSSATGDYDNAESSQVSLDCDCGLGVLDIYSGCHEETEFQYRRRKVGRVERSPISLFSLGTPKRQSTSKSPRKRSAEYYSVWQDRYGSLWG